MSILKSARKALDQLSPDEQEQEQHLVRYRAAILPALIGNMDAMGLADFESALKLAETLARTALKVESLSDKQLTITTPSGTVEYAESTPQAPVLDNQTRALSEQLKLASRAYDELAAALDDNPKDSHENRIKAAQQCALALRLLRRWGDRQGSHGTSDTLQMFEGVLSYEVKKA